MTQFRISGKNLGALALPSFCERCFWFKTHLDKIPWSTFPGIFSSIDSYTKKVTHAHFHAGKGVPPWLAFVSDFIEPVKVPNHVKFNIVDADTNILLTGDCDDVFRRADGSYFIVDYKTAKYTGNQDSLMPIYETQLNAYAYIANRTGFSPVTGIGLAYYEPQTNLKPEEIELLFLKDGFNLSFKCSLHELTLAPDAVIPPLLARVRSIVDLPKPPVGRSGCQDCVSVDFIVKTMAA